MTRDLKRISEKLDVQLLDHFIVGKKNVYSFANDIPEYVSSNEDYRKLIEKQAKTKDSKQHAFEIEM